MRSEVADWPRLPISALIESGAIRRHKDGNYGSKYPRANEFGAVGIPFLTATCLSSGKIDILGAPRLPEERAQGLEYGFIEPDDVLLSHNATIGRVAVVPDWPETLMVGTSLTYFRVDPEQILPGYLAAFFVASDFQNQLASVMSHTTRNQVPITAQRHLEIVLPPMRVQQEIAATLGSIDNKIANNRALATDLEAMARAIFKSWFVDFDPVKAKMEGRAPVGMDADTAALFPDALVESELGLIPKGWDVSAIADLCKIVGGATPSTKNSEHWNEGRHFWATPKDLSSLSSPVLWGTSRQITDGGLAKISSGLLPKGTVLLSSRAPIGYLAITQVPMAINQGFIAMKPLNGASSAFLMLWAKTFMDLIVGNANGSTFQEISKKSFRPIQLVRPPVDVLDAFSSLASPLFDTIANLDAESARLADLRDTLLPRLISGKLRLPETETSTGQELTE